MRSISCVEGVPVVVGTELRDRLRLAAERLQLVLKPRMRMLFEDRGQFTISGVVGTIDLGGGTVIDIRPKTSPDEDWITAVLDLLIGTDRIDAAGERIAGLSEQRRSLLEVMASIYTSRLERALERDGPIQLIVRQRATISYLRGKLDATRWVRHAALAPHRFPVTYDSLSADNDFSRVLAAAARLLANTTHSPMIRGRLLSTARRLRPGLPEDITISPGLVHRRLPAQWAIYEGAWSIAVALLAQRSLLRTIGHYRGISIAIEAWPLLERLLHRSLAAAARLSVEAGRPVQVAPQADHVLLTEPSGSAEAPRVVRPDGRLVESGRTVATFEAKYKRRLGSGSWPDRDDVFQALSTAAACRSPMAILVYPEAFPIASWRVQGMQGYPERLAAVGLALFSYRSGTGDEERGRIIMGLLEGAPSAKRTGAGAGTVLSP